MLEQVLLHSWALWLKASQHCQTPRASEAGTEQIKIHLFCEREIFFFFLYRKHSPALLLLKHRFPFMSHKRHSGVAQ